jgi:hypothetical protein
MKTAHAAPWSEKYQDQAIGEKINTECPIDTYNRRTGLIKKILIRNKQEAEKIARFYINDDVYLNIDPARMTSIIMQLKEYIIDPNIISEMDKILEVCSNDEIGAVEILTFKSKM